MARLGWIIAAFLTAALVISACGGDVSTEMPAATPARDRHANTHAHGNAYGRANDRRGIGGKAGFGRAARLRNPSSNVYAPARGHRRR